MKLALLNFPYQLSAGFLSHDCLRVLAIMWPIFEGLDYRKYKWF